ncbi:MAG TPA: ATP-binding protein [Dongiaceae bacterium]|jgi:SpoVK/Ycf46/Vps4 family AAA+-type ATPase|nr:ATP-binding protein [Dongiaceae bacterium]
MTISSKAATAAYLRGLMRSFAPDSKPGQKLVEWLRQNRDQLGFDLEAALRLPAPSAGQRIRLPESTTLLPVQWAAVSDALAAMQGAAVTGDPVSANIAALAGALGLDREAADVFRFVIEAERDKSFEWLCTLILSTRCVDTLGLIAAGIGSDPTTVWNAVCTGPLGTLQLVKLAANGGDELACFVPPRIAQALMPPNLGLPDIERHLIGRFLAPILDAEDFGHIAAELQFVKRLLGQALESGRTGVNILLHGIPGTGKTEFCKTVAAALGADLFGVGEVDDWGGEPDRSERLDALMLADRLAEHRGHTLLLFDEMQDLLRSDDTVRATYARRGRHVGSKVFMNRLLEQNRVPILWASNDIYAFDPAYIRRMSYVLEMKPLPLKARTRMIAKTAERCGMVLAQDQAVQLARRYRVAPGIVGTAIASAQAAGGDAAEITFAADALARAVEQFTPPAAVASVGFNVALVNADIDLAALERRATQFSAPRDLSLFLYGPPGTGKSAFARHLAEAMDMEPLFRRASDLLSKWVGETEQRLADAFAEARDDRRFLIIDEAEPFLWSRSGDSRSWEVSMVDEFLVQMESHPLPLVCTSNLLEAVDSAALRRFTLKIKFDFLAWPQVEGAYRHFFRRPAPPALRQLTALTPSDFASVIKQCRLLGGDAAADDARLVDLLEREIALKKIQSRRIGF